MALESKGKFLVNKILIFGSALLPGHGANPIFFNKKKKAECPEHLLPHAFLRPITFLATLKIK